ncbi:hypothetical protein AJ79_02646 [Helicocarpus griseus UAMH5409]|uniref:Uncharacterized protein n=1 Tax=Helicocarpus griseus UAMH5409 TaxID=1447875 RepID=A0A2B7Y1G4_9EURO|nr:hypothetical protein AJ79_02646 [Helicocarpus griseus UAMH5409]
MDANINAANIVTNKLPKSHDWTGLTRASDYLWSKTSVLHTVCHMSSPEFARLLLENGADTSVRDSTGWAPLHMIAALGDQKLSQLLLDSGADINMCCGDGDMWCGDVTFYVQESPMHNAIRQGRYHIVQMLAEAGADHGVESHRSRSSLSLAASEERALKSALTAAVLESSDLSIAKALLDAGAAVSRRTFSRVISRDERDFLQAFLKAGTDVIAIQDHLNQRNNSVSPPLLARAISLEVVEMLLRAAPALATSEIDGEMTLLDAYYSGRRCMARVDPNKIVPIAMLLIKHGATVRYINRDNWRTTLHNAARLAHARVVEAVLKMQPSCLNLTDRDLNTPLHLAAAVWASAEKQETIRHLVEAGSDVNALNIRGQTPLHRLYERGYHAQNAAITSYLLDAGTDVNIQAE